MGIKHIYKLKRLNSLILCCFLILSLSSFNVYADKTTTESTTESSESTTEEKKSEGGMTDDDMLAILKFKVWLPRLSEEEALKKLKSFYACLISDGYTPEAACGILGNIAGEGGLDPLCANMEKSKSANDGRNIIDGYVLCGGLFGFTPMSKYTDSDEAKQCKHKKVVTESVHGNSITKYPEDTRTLCEDGSCELLYYLHHLSDSYAKELATLYNPTIERLKNGTSPVPKDEIEKAKNKSAYIEKVPEISSFEEYKKLTNVVECCIIFNFCWERSVAANFILNNDNWNNHPSNANSKSNFWHWADSVTTDLGDYHSYEGNSSKTAFSIAFYKYFAGKDIKDLRPSDGTGTGTGDGTDTVKEYALTSFNMGYYSEKDLESYCELNELNFTDMLAEASRDNLSQDDLDTVKAWEDNITTHPVLNAFRVTIMVLGILLTVWAIFFYLAYWLQRVNNFVDIEFISLLSLGKFQMADEETNSNYGGLTKNAENGKTLVNHKAVVKICLVTLFLGVMLITGLIYNFVLWVIQLVTGTLHK